MNTIDSFEMCCGSDKKTYGWICPNCDTIHTPFVSACVCSGSPREEDQIYCIVLKNKLPVDSVISRPDKKELNDK